MREKMWLLVYLATSNKNICVQVQYDLPTAHEDYLTLFKNCHLSYLLNVEENIWLVKYIFFEKYE